MKKRRTKIFILMLPFILIPVIAVAASVYDRFRYLMLPCPLYGLFHLYCPGCGGTRFVYALLSGDFLRALRCNALFMAALTAGILLWVENLFSLAGKNIKIIPRSRAFIITASGLAAAYVILRNIISFLAPPV